MSEFSGIIESLIIEREEIANEGLFSKIHQNHVDKKARQAANRQTELGSYRKTLANYSVICKSIVNKYKAKYKNLPFAPKYELIEDSLIIEIFKSEEYVNEYAESSLYNPECTKVFDMILDAIKEKLSNIDLDNKVKVSVEEVNEICVSIFYK